jgi:hypothetical protein
LPIFIEFELFYNDIFGIKKLADVLNAQAHLEADILYSGKLASYGIVRAADGY